VVLIGWTLRGAQLEYSLAVLCRDGRNDQTRPTFKRNHERAFDAEEAGSGRRRVPKWSGGLHEFLVLCQMQLGSHQRLQCGRRDEQIERGRLRAEVEIKGADRRK